MSGHKWFAALYERMAASAEKGYMKDVRREVAGGASGSVLEVGAGTGLNFSYYTEDASEVVATEPDPYMLERARGRAADAGRPITLQQAPAEELPFDDCSFDTVVSTLVLCTVDDPHQALSEVTRVLKPAGQFRFFEHVRYGHAFGAFWQDVITPVWSWCGAGCRPNRDIASILGDAGLEFQQFARMMPLPPIPPMAFVRPCIKGVAVPKAVDSRDEAGLATTGGGQSQG